MSQFAEVFNRFRQTQPNQRGADIPVGEHIFAVIEYSFRHVKGQGNIIGVDFEVVQSSTLPAGTKCRDAFFIDKAEQDGGRAENEKCLAFTNALIGAAPNDSERFAKAAESFTTNPAQPARGLLVKCTAYTQSKVAGPKSKKAGQQVSWTEKKYEHIADQSNQAAIRAQLDQRYPLPAAVPMQPPQQAAAPAYGYPAQAPQQPAYAPPPGYGAPPAPAGWPQQPPAAPPAPAWGPPPAPAQPAATPALPAGAPAGLAAFLPRG